jgi:acetyltransferase-like isoleucine patch superfamily enzyme
MTSIVIPRRAISISFHWAGYLSGALGDWIFTAVARVRLWLAGVKVGSRFRATGWINLRIHPTADVTIGQCVRFNSGSRRNLVGGGQRLGIYAGRGAKVRIGDRVGMSSTVIIATTGVSIHSDSLVGGGCLIVDSDLHALPLLGRHATAVRSRPVVVGEGVFVGAHSVILKGSSIGKGAVIGAGSVVAGIVSPGVAVASQSLRRIPPASLPPSGGA